MQAEGADEINTKAMRPYRSRRSSSTEANQGDLEQGNLKQEITRIQVKGGSSGSLQDGCSRAVRVNGRKAIKCKNMFPCTQFFPIHEKLAVQDV
jgi:hypothetical protein